MYDEALIWAGSRSSACRNRTGCGIASTAREDTVEGCRVATAQASSPPQSCPTRCACAAPRARIMPATSEDSV